MINDKFFFLAVVVATIACAGIFWYYRWKLRKDLLPILEDIDRELEYYSKSRLD
jgi:hypothetical protein